MHSIVRTLFDKIYYHFYSEHYRVPDKKIDIFLTRLSKHHDLDSIGEDWLTTYFKIQTLYWQDKVTERKLNVDWFIGPKALKRYLDTDKEKYLWLVSKFLEIDLTLETEISTEYEDSQRKKFHNTPEGFAHCIQFTSLYRRCITCLACRYKSDCQKLQQTYFAVKS